MATVDEYRALIGASLQPGGIREDDAPTDIRGLIERVAQREGVPTEIALRMAELESGLKPKAVGPETKYGRAQGLYQIMPAFAADYGVNDPLDPEQNATGALRTLRKNFERFGDWRRAIAAHHAGASAVERAGGVPDTADANMATADYVQRVLGGSDAGHLDGRAQALHQWIRDYLAPKPPPPEEYGFRPWEAIKKGVVGALQ